MLDDFCNKYPHISGIFGLILIGIILYIPLHFYQLVDYFMSKRELNTCIKEHKCEYKPFGRKKYIFKNKYSAEIDLYGLFDDAPAVVNTETGVIHLDYECDYAKTCTKNCIYMPYTEAKKMLSDNPLAKYCKHEEEADRKYYEEHPEEIYDGIDASDCDPIRGC